MRVVIVGGGMAGLVLARALVARGVAPVVLERMPAGTAAHGPIMLPFQAYDALADIGVLERLRALGRDIAPRPDGTPVAIAVARRDVLGVLSEGLEPEHGVEVVGLLSEDGRVVGVRATGPGGARDVPADLVAGADGTMSRVRDLAGFPFQLEVSPDAGLSFRSPVAAERPFVMAYQSDGRQIGLLGWPGGTAGWWQIDRIGAGAALAPGLEAFKRSFLRLLPAAEAALDGVTSMDQVRYSEVTEVRCEEWWRPGVVLLGEALHAMNPEAGMGAGLGMGDALALAVAIGRNPGNPDAACRDYEHWRRPAIAPYLSIGPQGSRIVTGGARPVAERWPPSG